MRTNFTTALIAITLFQIGLGAWAEPSGGSALEKTPCAALGPAKFSAKFLNSKSGSYFRDLSSSDLLDAILESSSPGSATSISMHLPRMIEGLTARPVPSAQTTDALIRSGTVDTLMKHTFDWSRQTPWYKTSLSLVVDWVLGIPTVVASEEEMKVEQAKWDGNPNYSYEEPTWLGLSANALNTPYEMFQTIPAALKLKAGTTVVDMGSGFGRFGVLIGLLHPELNFIGYEFHPHRLQAGEELARRHNWNNVHFYQADFAAKDFRPAPADVYFTYWSAKSEKIMRSLFEKLLDVARVRKIKVVCRSFRPDLNWPQWQSLNRAIVNQGPLFLKENEESADLFVFTLDTRPKRRSWN